MRAPRLFSAVLLGLLLLLGAGAPAHAFLYETTAPTQPAVSNFHLVDVFVEGSLRLEWSYTAMGSHVPVFDVQRRLAGTNTWTSLGTTTNRYFLDATIAFGTDYEYRVGVIYDEGDTMGLPPPPAGADPADIYVRGFVPTSVPYDDGIHAPILDRDWRCLLAAPIRVTAGQNQTVDSRYDPRYATYVFKDFCFGDMIYRGGLFAGFNQDSSRVSRSFARFSLPSLASGRSVLAGSMNAFATRAYTLGTTTSVACAAVSDVTWLQSSLKWSTAPTLPTGFGDNYVDITYHTVTMGMTTYNEVSVDNRLSYLDAGGSWAHWMLTDDINAAAAGSGALSVALASKTETTSGWIYFAKKEWDSNNGPRLVYAVGGTAYPVSLSLDQSATSAGTARTGTVVMAGGGAVTLSSSDSTIASVPGSLSGGGSFTVTTYSGHTGSVTIYATASGITRSVTLTVN